jgi:hypothetical protein
VSLLALSGCSLVGYGGGYLLESNTYRGDALQKRLPMGAPVIVTDTSGTRIEGTYTGIEELPSPRDSLAYTAVRAAASLPVGSALVRLPVWGTEVVLSGSRVQPEEETRADTLRGQFVGFGLRAATVEEVYLRVRRRSGTVARVPLERLDQVQLGSVTYSRRALALGAASVEVLPTVMAVAIDTATSAPALVPLGAVRHAEGPRRKQRRWIGLGIGLTTDLIIIAAAAELSGDWFPNEFSDGVAGGE